MNKFVIGLVGCLGVLIGGGISGRQASGEEQAEFGGWSAPVNLGPVINSSVRDVGASVSRDGLSLYFSSARAGTTDLYFSRRRAVDLPWETPEPLAMLNTDVGDSGPSLSRDNRYLFFSSNRTGGFGSTDFFVSERRFTQDDLGWGPPTRLPSPPNSAGQEVEPLFIENPGGRPQLYFASGATAAGLDIYASELREDGTWTAPEYLVALNSASEEGGLAIRFDGKEGIFASRRGGVDLDLYVTHRKHRWDAWSEPENLGSIVNSTASDFSPSLSPNGRTLYFASARTGGLGNFDLYVSTRSRIRWVNAHERSE